jgi:hypothetical protein
MSTTTTNGHLSNGTATSTTTTPAGGMLGQLARAEAGLTASITTATAALEQLGAGAVEAALDRMEKAAARAGDPPPLVCRHSAA